jgi:hypothetical protein
MEDDLLGLDKANIRFLLNPNFDTAETDMRAAERAVGGGFGGSGFASGLRGRLLDSERISRAKLGNEMLAPYLQRSFTAGESALQRGHEVGESARERAARLQELQLREAGEGARLTEAERGEMERLLESGRIQARDRLVTEAGLNQRANMSLIGSLLNRGGSSGGGTTRPGLPGQVAPLGTNDISSGYSFGMPDGTQPFRHPSAITSDDRGSGYVSSSSIDRLLRRYGLN